MITDLVRFKRRGLAWPGMVAFRPRANWLSPEQLSKPASVYVVRICKPPLLTLCLRDHNGSLPRKFLEERAYATLTPTSFSTRPQQQLMRHLFYKGSGHKEAVRQLHYAAEDLEDVDEVD